MTRADPQRLAAAQREGILSGWSARLHVSRETAEAWMRAWEFEAVIRGRLATDWDFWTAGERWVVEQRSAGKRP